MTDHYQRVLSKCTNLDSDKRYRSVKEVECALFGMRRKAWCIAALVVLCMITGIVLSERIAQRGSDSAAQTDENGLLVLPAPEEPHWDEDTGIAVWKNVPESGEGDIMKYDWKLYRCDTPTPLTLRQQNVMRNAVCGDGVTYADSPYVLSDAFEFTDVDAPLLPTPQNLSWVLKQDKESNKYFASFENWDDYEDKDTIQVFVFDEEGEWVCSLYYYKEELVEDGLPGILIQGEYVNRRGKLYRFAIQVTSSSPNEYRASPPVFPWPEDESYFSPWLDNS